MSSKASRLLVDMVEGAQRPIHPLDIPPLVYVDLPETSFLIELWTNLVRMSSTSGVLAVPSTQVSREGGSPWGT